MNKKLFLMMIIGALAIGMIGCGAGGDGEVGTEGLESEEFAPSSIPTNDSVETVKAFGVVSAKKDVSVSVDFDAKVEKIFVQAGEKIAKGDLLVAFDITSTDNLIKTKERELEQLKSKLYQKSYAVDKLNLQLVGEKNSLTIIEEDYANKLKLQENGSLSVDELNKVKNSIEDKKRMILSTELNILSTKADESNAKKSTRNQMVNLTEEINRLKDKLVKSNFIEGNKVVCSFDSAIVTEVMSKEGDFVNRTNNVMTITDLGSRIITADIAEEFISKIKVGQTVKITSSALPDKEYTGKVSRVWGSSVKKNGETIVPIEISIDNLDDELLLNFNVDAEINLEAGI